MACFGAENFPGLGRAIHWKTCWFWLRKQPFPLENVGLWKVKPIGVLSHELKLRKARMKKGNLCGRNQNPI